KDTRDWVTSRVAPTKSAPALNTRLSDCSSPNSTKAITTDSSVSDVRVFLWNRLARTNPVLVMALSSVGQVCFRKQALVQVHRVGGELGGLGVVGDHDDGLAVLAVQYLQQAQDLVGGLAVQ